MGSLFRIVETPRTDLPTPNHNLLSLLLSWAKTEYEKRLAGLPSEWDQSKWINKAGELVSGTACGTTCCIAGKAVLSMGANPVDNSATNMWGFERVVAPNGEEYEVPDLAQEILGLTDQERSELFFGRSTYSDVERVINGILDGTNYSRRPMLTKEYTADRLCDATPGDWSSRCVLLSGHNGDHLYGAR